MRIFYRKTILFQDFQFQQISPSRRVFLSFHAILPCPGQAFQGKNGNRARPLRRWTPGWQGNAVPPLQQAPRKSPRPREGRGTRRIHSAPASRKQGIKQHQRQIGASGQQQPARLQIPCLSQENRQHRKDGRDIHIRKNSARFLPFPRLSKGIFQPENRRGNAGSTA